METEDVKQWYYRHYPKDGYCEKRCFQKLSTYHETILTVQQVQDALDKWNRATENGYYSHSPEGRRIGQWVVESMKDVKE
jgi:hypothetical protein